MHKQPGILPPETPPGSFPICLPDIHKQPGSFPAAPASGAAAGTAFGASLFSVFRSHSERDMSIFAVVRVSRQPQLAIASSRTHKLPSHALFSQFACCHHFYGNVNPQSHRTSLIAAVISRMRYGKQLFASEAEL
ncbi:hypothetical protein L596_012470 [Steinernema carpocapsae]|uniref:Uncharacterized protein n=1 Tax=Steinernema carpocapsae TaxID=34508 RepID=A0A4V6A4U6_STECR|nr:hypothetical protein L596_012470 [Steinernema carpocapsae]